MVRYDSFDEIILFNWIKCNEGKLRFVRLNEGRELSLNSIETISSWLRNSWPARFWKTITFNRKFRKDAALDKIAWEKIYEGFLKQVPRNEDFEDYLDARIQRAELQYEFIISAQENGGKRNRFLLNRIKILDAKIAGFEKRMGKGQKMTSVINKLSKLQGYQIKIKEITAAEYFQLIEDNSRTSKPEDDEQAS